MKECIFQIFQSFHSIFPLSMIATAQNAVSLAKPFTDEKLQWDIKIKASLTLTVFHYLALSFFPKKETETF